MGYNTRYTISLSGQSSEEENNEILATQIYNGLTIARFVDGDVDEMKWYDHENDMTALSIKYPHVTFTLEGCGEETFDLWKKYFLGGQMQRADAEITYPPCTLTPPPTKAIENARRKRLRAKLDAHFTPEERKLLAKIVEDESQKKDL
jgi:hypothetical protein